MKTVVTGLGVISPIGHSVQETWQNLCDGVSGADRITHFDPEGFPVQIATEVKDFNPEDWMSSRLARRTDLCSQYSIAAARQALNDSRLEVTEDNDTTTAVILDTGAGGTTEIETGTRLLMEKGPRLVSPILITNAMPNAPAAHISILTGAKGPVISSAAACASGNLAFLEAARLMRTGEAKAVIAGGGEASLTPVAMAAFGRSGACSTRNDEPEKASRPFDAHRDGFVFGEGAAVMVIEREENALARGAHIYCEVVGGAQTADAYHITAPAPGGEGAARAMANALEYTGMAPKEIDCIFAHGTGTPLNDVAETQAIKSVFGDHAYEIPISATKSMVGHLLGGAGALSGLAAVLAIRDGIIPPTINLEITDPECDLDYVPLEARRHPIRSAMVNGFGFGGQNVAVIFRAYEP